MASIKCQYCGKGYAHRSSKSRHIAKFHKELHASQVVTLNQQHPIAKQEAKVAEMIADETFKLQQVVNEPERKQLKSFLPVYILLCPECYKINT